jgi:hypothetical protein
MIFQSETHFIGFGEGLVNSNPLSRRRIMNSSSHKEHYSPANEVQEVVTNHRDSQWKRIVLLIVAITVHNIPGKFSNHQVGGMLYMLWFRISLSFSLPTKVINNIIYRTVTLPFVLDMNLPFIARN